MTIKRFIQEVQREIFHLWEIRRNRKLNAARRLLGLPT
jgi:hypothetical protein